MNHSGDNEKIYDYDLVSYEEKRTPIFTGSLYYNFTEKPRKLTETEAQCKNQALALNGTTKRFVRVESRRIKE